MGVVPLDETIFSMPVLVMSLVLFVTLPFLNAWAMPKSADDIIKLDPEVYKHDEIVHTADALKARTIAERLNGSAALSATIGLIGLCYMAFYFVNGGALDINAANFIIIFLGVLLMKSPARYVAALNEGAKAADGVILQYPFYAGIMAMMGGSGLVTTMAQWFVNISTAELLPFWGMVSSFVINFFAPSAGGHWVIQGPFMIEAAQALHADAAKTAMAVMPGNAWNDLAQPFWLPPTLAISGLKLSDVPGYTILAMLWTTIVFSVGIIFWGFM